MTGLGSTGYRAISSITGVAVVRAIITLLFMLGSHGCGNSIEVPGDSAGDSDPTAPAPADGLPLAGPTEIASATWGVAIHAIHNQQDVFLVFGTSFAIGEYWLATNAHVIDGAKDFVQLLEPGMQLVIVQHETKVYCPIDAAYIHPEYDALRFLTTPDVGILVAECRMPTIAPIAEDAILTGLDLLDGISLCGFPSDVTLSDIELGSRRPRATCLTGNITGFRPFDLNEPTTTANTAILQHDIQTSAGTSGGAIFDALGRVVAINSAGTVDATASNRFAIRIDQLRGLQAGIVSGHIPPTILATPPISACLAGNFWNEEFGFGFDPPSGFIGPVTNTNASREFLYSSDFVRGQFLSVNVSIMAAYGDLDGWISAWVEGRTIGGLTLLDRQDIRMPTGVEAVMLEWLDPSVRADYYWIELWSISRGFQFRFASLLYMGEYGEFGEDIRRSFRSVCID